MISFAAVTGSVAGVVTGGDSSGKARTAPRIGLIAAHPATHSPTAVYARELGTALRQLANRPEVFPVLAARESQQTAERAIITLNDAASYGQARAALGCAQLTALLLQHDFDSLPAGGSEQLLALLSGVNAPLIATLHDVPTHPTAEQLAVVQGISARASAIVVVARKAADILEDTFEVPTKRIEVIRGGVHVGSALPSALAKSRLGLGGQTVLMTAGLLSHDMGVEVVLEALPGLVRSFPKLVYFVLGETHPKLREREGESYRGYLSARAAELGVADNFRMCADYRSGYQLRETLSAADIYISPYLSEAVAASQTLTTAVAAGRPVLATPSWYASELLRGGAVGDGAASSGSVGGAAGELVPFGSPSAFGAAIDGLLRDPRRMRAMRRQAIAAARPMQWSKVAECYGELLFGRGKPETGDESMTRRLPGAEFGSDPMSASMGPMPLAG